MRRTNSTGGRRRKRSLRKEDDACVIDLVVRVPIGSSEIKARVSLAGTLSVEDKHKRSETVRLVDDDAENIG